MVLPAAASEAGHDVASAVRSRDHVAWLEDVLREIAVDAIGHEAPRTIGGRAGDRILRLVERPVAAAADAAFQRLAHDLRSALELAPDLVVAPRDPRRSAGLGID